MKQVWGLVLLLVFICGGYGLAEALETCNEKSKLGWVMNTEADMDYYMLYHSNATITDTGSVGVAAVQVPHDPDSAVENSDTGVKSVVESFPTSLPEGDRYFRVTAVDTTGNESALSNEASCNVNFSPIAPILFLQLG